MPTLNLPISKTWTKLADAADAHVLITSGSVYAIEYATVADATPPDVLGHLLTTSDQAITRDLIGSGNIYARIRDDRAPADETVTLIVTR